MATQDLIVQEIADMPPALLEEALDFLRYLKQKHRQEKSVLVVSKGQETRVAVTEVLGSEALKDRFLRLPLSPVEQIQQELRAALAAGGYETREHVVDLVQEVKREMFDERLTVD